jgi:hypothetical protein
MLSIAKTATHAIMTQAPDVDLGVRPQKQEDQLSDKQHIVFCAHEANTLHHPDDYLASISGGAMVPA